MNERAQVLARPLIAVMLALMMSVAAADAQTQIKSGFNLFSPEQDVEIGRQSVAEVERQMPVVSDREVWGRPSSVAVQNDGSLLAVDDVTGEIWRVSPVTRAQ